MSSNIPSIQPKENQIKDSIGNLKIYEQKASDPDFENLISKDIERDMAPNTLNPLDKKRFSSKTETEAQ